MHKTTAKIIGLIATLCLLANSTWAEDGVIEEVVVTAQKRAQSTQDIPIAVTAFTGDMVEEAGVKDIRDIAGFTPGLSIKSRGDTEASVFIRGIGSQAPGIGADPAVGIYIDGVYASRGTNATAAFFDVDRVEVVKGPQGTLFGRNASAGAIAIHTARPDTTEQSGSVLVGFGDEGQQKYEAIFNLPLSETFAIRLGAKHDARDGLYENSTNGDELNDRDHTNVRASALYEGDTFESHFVAEYIEMDTLAGFVSAADAFASNVALNDNPDDQTLESWRLTWNNSWDLGDTMTFTSVTGYYTHEVNVTPVDADLVDVPVVTFEEPQNNEYFSQEFRLNGTADAVDWFVGASFARERLDFVNDLVYDEAIVAALFGLNDLDADNADACDGAADFDLDGDGIGDTGLLTGLPTCPVVSETPQGDGITESWAVYGDVTWHVTEQFDITVGLRYTEDDKEITYNNPATAGLLGIIDGQIFGPITAGDVKADETFDSLDPRIALNYFANDDVMFFFNASSGYKAGGLNRQIDPVSRAIRPFAEEEVVAYEIGIKSTFWDGRGQLNVSVFSNEYEDFQLEELINLIPQVDNVGDVDVRGIDIEFKALVTDQFEVTATYGMLDTEIDSDDPDQDGNDAPQAADNVFSVRASYSVPVGEGELSVSGSWQYSDSFYFDVFNTLEQDSYDVWNARVAWESEQWVVALVGENLGDEEYLAEQFNFLDVTTIRAPGRYVRAEVGFRF